MSNTNDKQIRCSFCGKTQDEVARLVEGPGVYICDRCVEFCSSLIFDEPFAPHPEKKSDKKAFSLLKPQEIKEKLDQYVIGQDDAKEQSFTGYKDKNIFFLQPFILEKGGFCDMIKKTKCTFGIIVFWKDGRRVYGIKRSHEA